MTETSDDPAGRERRLDEALGAYLVARDEGRGPDLGALLAAHPDLAGDLAAFFADADRLDALAGPLRPAATPAPTLAHVGSTDAPSPAFGEAADPAASTVAVAPGGGGEDEGRWPRGTVVRYLGDYELREVIGRGGMGVVWRAHQRSLNRPVALKMMRAGAGAGPEELRRFRVEAEAAAGLDHPNIVPIFEVGEFQGESYFSMKLIDGDGLDRLLPRYAAEPRAAAALVAEVARAVHHAHQRGVLHRDLKPANILVDRQGRPHVTDYGLAKRVQDDAGQTLSGAVLGTPGYMSPEQAAGRVRSITTAADVYGLGAVLFAMLTGRAPFRGDSVMATLDQVRERSPERPRALNARVERDLETICLRCLEKDPRRRYDSAAALAEDLERYLRREPIDARRTGPWERAAMWARRRPASAALVAVSALAMMATVAVGIGSVYHTRLKESYREVERAEKKASASLVREEQFHYYNRLGLADREWQAGNVSQAERLLDDCPSDLRGWEWHHLKRLCHADLRTIPAHDGFVAAIAYSPDGRYVVSGDARPPVRSPGLRVWDAATGREIAWMGGKIAHITSLAFSPDGSRLAASTGDNNSRQTPGEVVVWDFPSGRKRLSLSDHPGGVFRVAFSPDGRRIASASGVPDKSGEFKVWDAATGKAQFAIKAHNELLYNLAFSPDGQYLATADGTRSTAAFAGKPGEVKLWDAGTGREIRSLPGHSMGIFALAFSPDGSRVVTGGLDQEVRVSETATGRDVMTLRGQASWTHAVAFRPDGGRMVTAVDDGTIRVWDTTTGREVRTLRGHSRGVMSVAYSPDGTRIASGSADGTVKFWDPETDPATLVLRGDSGHFSAVVFSPDGTRIAASSQHGTVRVWDSRTGRPGLILRGPSDLYSAVAFSPDGTRIAAVSANSERDDLPGIVRIWNDRGESKELRGHDGSPSWVNFSPDGTRIATADYDNTVRIQDPNTGAILLTLRGHSAQVYAVAYSPDGRTIASSSFDKTVKLWDTTTGREIRTLDGHGVSVFGVAFSPDGKQLASGGGDSTARIWDVVTGEPVATLRGHSHYVYGVAFSPDGKRLATGSPDRTVKVWDVSTRQQVLTLRGHTGPVMDVAFSPDGGRIASAGGDGTVRIWKADIAPEIREEASTSH